MNTFLQKYYLAGGNLLSNIEEYIKKIKESTFDLSKEDNSYILNIVDDNNKMKIYVKISKNNVFHMQYFRDTKELLHIHYESSYLETKIDNNKLIHLHYNNNHNNVIYKHSVKFTQKMINLNDDDIKIIKATIKKIYKSDIFQKIFDKTDLKDNLIGLFTINTI